MAENTAEEKVTEKQYFESSAGDGTKREDMYLEGKELLLCFIAVFSCFFLFALDQTIVATLLSTVGNKFDSFDKIGWLSAGFLISMCVLVAVWGKLGIIFGRKYTMMVAIVLFEAGSLMCALANNMNILIGGRVLAGIGGGGVQSITFIIITEVLPMHKRPLGMAVVSIVFAVASVLGPLIGGAFTSNVSWRWCFYINLPIGGFAFCLFTYAYNPPKPKGNIKQKLLLIDYPGVVLLAGGLVVFLLALTFGASGQYSWHSAGVIACFVVGGVVTIIYFIWNFRFSKNPMLPWEVVRVPQVEAASITLFGGFGYFMSAVLYLAVYFQVIHDASAWRSGVDLLPLIISVVVTAFSTGVLVKKTRFVKPFALFGAVIGMIGCGLLTLLEVDSSSSKKIGLQIPAGIGIGALMQSCIIAGQLSAPKGPGGVIMVTTLINFYRSFGGALSANLADVVYSTSFLNRVVPALSKQSQSVISELSNVDILSLINSTTAMNELSLAARTFLKLQMMLAIKDTFYMNLGFAAIAMIAVVFTTNKRLPAETPKKEKAIEQEATASDESENSGETETQGSNAKTDNDESSATNASEKLVVIDGEK